MTTLSASPGNVYGDSGMLGMNSTEAEVQWFCENTNMCGLPAFAIGVVGIMFFLISCLVWCYIYRTRLHKKTQRTTEEYNGGKELMERISDNPTFYDKADEYQMETKRRYEKDPTQKLCTQTKSCDDYDYVTATDVTNGDRKIKKEKLGTHTNSSADYDYIDSRGVTSGNGSTIKEKLGTHTKSSADYDYIESRGVISGNGSTIKEIPMMHTYANENEMHIHSDLKTTRNLDNLKKNTPISDLGHIGNTPIASEDEQINNPSSVQGQKVNDTKTNPQLLPELTRQLNQKYGKAKSEDVDNVNALSIEDSDNRMLVHGKISSEILEDVHSDRTRDFDDNERMEGPREILTRREDIQGTDCEETSNPVYENFDKSDKRESSDSSNSDESCAQVTNGVNVYKPRGSVHVTVMKNYYGHKMVNHHKTTGADRHVR